MKQLILADVHIKLGAKNVPIDWAKNRYNLFIEKICELSNSVDNIVICGDTFDRVPTLDEMAIFFDIISNLDKPTFIFDGNHESTKKGCTFLSLLAPLCKAVNSKVSIVTEVTEYSWGTILPYCKLKEKNVFSSLDKSKPLFTHVRGEIPPHVNPEIDLSLLKDFPIVYAGDLHSYSNSQLNIVYPGSPMTTSFHRSEVNNGVIIANGVEHKWVPLGLPQLIRKTVESEDEILETEYNYTIYEMKGSMSDLSNIKNSDLLDRKIIKRSTEASLLLDKEMTISQELSEYLLYILELPEDEVREVVGVFSDYIKES